MSSYRLLDAAVFEGRIRERVCFDREMAARPLNLKGKLPLLDNTFEWVRRMLEYAMLEYAMLEYAIYTASSNLL